MSNFNKHINPISYHKTEAALLHSVDCVILGFLQDELKVLLIRFPYQPFKGHWSLIGGFVNIDTDIDTTARVTVEKMTNLENVYMEQVHTFGNVKRVPSERVITTCYYALINVEPTLHILSKEFDATWHSLDKLPPLVYDHEQMVRVAVDKLREKVRRQPIGFELLPKKFTMSQLLKLYESILGRSLDKRNFNKKILSMNLLEKLDEKDTENSKRGAFYFQFQLEKYTQLLSNGYLFDL